MYTEECRAGYWSWKDMCLTTCATSLKQFGLRVLTLVSVWKFPLIG